MGITYDPGTRERTLKEHGEIRMLCFGRLEGRLVVVGYTPRGEDRHIFSMRKANRREQNRLAPYFAIGSQAH